MTTDAPATTSILLEAADLARFEQSVDPGPPVKLHPSPLINQWDAAAARKWLEVDYSKQNERIRGLHEDGRKIAYLDDRHSHPYATSGTPSRQDRLTLAQLAAVKPLSCPDPVMVILHPDGDGWVAQLGDPQSALADSAHFGSGGAVRDLGHRLTRYSANIVDARHPSASWGGLCEWQNSRRCQRRSDHTLWS